MSKGGGGWCDTLGYFRVSYPPHIQACNFPIAALECFNLLLSIRLWQLDWTGKHVLIFSDNWAVVCALQSGRAQEPLIQACMREMWWIAALGDIEITVRHKPEAELALADALSRVSSVTDTNSRFHKIIQKSSLPEHVVLPEMLGPPLPI